MSNRNRVLDAVIDGEIGNGLIVRRAAVITHFPDINASTIGVLLSNSEMETGRRHSPNYVPFTMRISEGVYRIHPAALLARMTERGLL